MGFHFDEPGRAAYLLVPYEGPLGREVALYRRYLDEPNPPGAPVQDRCFRHVQ